MSDKQYHVWRRNGVVTCSIEEAGKPRRELHNIGLHSPDGFEMGYGGSGPSDLALTILCDFFGVKATPEAFQSGEMNDGQKLAWELHHDFRRKYIEPHHSMVLIAGDQIQEMMNEKFTITVDLPDVAGVPGEETLH